MEQCVTSEFYWVLMLCEMLKSIAAVEVWVDKSLKIEYNVFIGQRIKIGLSFTSKEIDSTAHISRGIIKMNALGISL